MKEACSNPDRASKRQTVSGDQLQERPESIPHDRRPSRASDRSRRSRRQRVGEMLEAAVRRRLGARLRIHAGPAVGGRGLAVLVQPLLAAEREEARAPAPARAPARAEPRHDRGVGGRRRRGGLLARHQHPVQQRERDEEADDQHEVAVHERVAAAVGRGRGVLADGADVVVGEAEERGSRGWRGG